MNELLADLHLPAQKRARSRSMATTAEPSDAHPRGCFAFSPREGTLLYVVFPKVVVPGITLAPVALLPFTRFGERGHTWCAWELLSCCLAEVSPGD